MADIDLKTSTPDTSLPTTGFLFGADSQAASAPSVFTTQAVATTLLGSTTLSGATITADAPVLNMSQTWNNAGVTFTGLKFNITDTASAAASLLMDLQIGGSSRFNIRKDGYITMADSTIAWGTTGLTLTRGSGVNMLIGSFVSVGQNGVALGNGTGVAFTASATPSTSQDLFLTRRGAANLRLGAADAAAPVAQTLSVQSVVTGTTNTAGANLTITGSQGTGTGAGGSIIFQVAPAGSSGTAQNALATAWTINSASQFVSGNAGTASAPSLVLSGADTGFFSASVGAVGFVSGGNESFRLESVLGFGFRSAGLLWWTSGSNGAYSNRDLVLARDAANTLALRNGTNAQRFNVYNTYTSATNYEAFKIDWITTANTVLVGTEKGSGGGTARDLAFQTDGTTRLTISASGVTTVSGNFEAYASSSFGTGGSATTWVRLGAGTTSRSQIRFSSGVAPSAPNDGDVWFDGTDLKMRIGGVTKTFTLI